MTYYCTCPLCGAHLDPCELCDCEKEEAAPGATNTQDGKVETSEESTSILSEK